ncbi:MAG: response regulator [bacterium]
MKKGTVLLIDDNQDMITIGEQIFVPAGYRYVSAECGRDGLKKLKAEGPDVVILDYLLPDIKGDELIERVAGTAEFADARSTPFVILTAWEEEIENMSLLYNKGLAAYLTKPFGHRELRCVIENVIQRNRARQPGPKSDTSPARKSGFWQESEVIADLANCVLGLSRTLLHSLDGELNEQQRTDLAAIHNCGKKLLRRFEARITATKAGKVSQKRELKDLDHQQST